MNADFPKCHRMQVMRFIENRCAKRFAPAIRQNTDEILYRAGFIHFDFVAKIGTLAANVGGTIHGYDHLPDSLYCLVFSIPHSQKR